MVEAAGHEADDADSAFAAQNFAQAARGHAAASVLLVAT
jgi:hypothetical protein